MPNGVGTLLGDQEGLGRVVQVVAAVVVELDALFELEVVAVVVGSVSGALPAADQPAEGGQLRVEAFRHLDVDVHSSLLSAWLRSSVHNTAASATSATRLVSPAATIITHARTLMVAVYERATMGPCVLW